MKTFFSNINQLWSHVLIKRCYQFGVSDFCLAPGSRNAPLTLELVDFCQRQGDIKIHQHFDERGLGFLALGLAKVERKPVVVMTTSGTAVANLHPAVIEARQQNVPLIILAADRPLELIGCGANQAIQQAALFGINVIHNLQLPKASTNTSCNQLIQLMDEALLATSGGPVHINCPFDEPLYPVQIENDYSDWIGDLFDTPDKHEFFGQGDISVKKNLFTANRLTDAEKVERPEFKLNQRTLVIAGHLNPQQANRVVSFCEEYNLPLLADINSQIRQLDCKTLVPYLDPGLNQKALDAWLSAYDQVIQFEGRLVSKRLLQWLADFSGQYCIVSEHKDYLDPNRKARQLQLPIVDFIDSVNAELFSNKMEDANPPQHLIEQSISVIKSNWNSGLNELSAVHALCQLLPSNASLFAGNSLSVRLLDMYEYHFSVKRIFSNRGASGIDGLFATAAGIARKVDGPMAVLLGDMSALYDLNSLGLLKHSVTVTGYPVVVIVLNNDGGSIFNLLPAAQFEQALQPYFQCPHGLDFEFAAKQFGLKYDCPNDLPALTAAIESALVQNPRAQDDLIKGNRKAPGVSLIEVKVPQTQSSEMIKAINVELAKC